MKNIIVWIKLETTNLFQKRVWIWKFVAVEWVQGVREENMRQSVWNEKISDTIYSGFCAIFWQNLSIF